MREQLLWDLTLNQRLMFAEQRATRYGFVFIDRFENQHGPATYSLAVPCSDQSTACLNRLTQPEQRVNLDSVRSIQ